MQERFPGVEAGEDVIPSIDGGVFSSTYPAGEIQRPEKLLLPEYANRYFQRHVQKYIEDGKVEDCFIVADRTGDVVYVAQTSGKRIGGANGKLDRERSLILTETRAKKEIGYGEVFLNLEDDGRLPVVGWTETLPKFRGQGLASRRLEILDGLAEAMWNKPMRSGLFTEDDDGHAEKAWKRLVEQGKAEYVEKGKFYRFFARKQLCG